MDVDNTFIKPILLFYFGKGKSEVEAHKEITQKYGQYAISLKTINMWFSVFRKGNASKADKRLSSSKKKFTDEFLINIINENPEYNMEELARVLNTTISNICFRIKKINSEVEREIYRKKNFKAGVANLTDEFVIDLVNKNPGLGIVNLAKLANTTAITLSKRIKQINSTGNKVNCIKAFIGKFTDDFLIDLVNENPDLTMAELASLAGSSVSTISNRLKKINSDGEKVKYISKRVKKDNSEGKKPKPRVVLTDEFIVDLIDKNPTLNMVELAKLADTSATTISNRIRKLGNRGERVNYNKKWCPKFTDEFLIDLINENPDLSMAKLAKLAHTSSSTISRRLKEINDKRESDCKIILQRDTHKETEKQKIIFTDEFLIDLVNDNPDLNMKELAKLANTSVPHLSKKLKKINWVDVRLNHGKNLSK